MVGKKIDIGKGQDASERQVMKWFKLAWKSAEREPISWKEGLLIIVIAIGIINIVVSALLR